MGQAKQPKTMYSI